MAHILRKKLPISIQERWEQYKATHQKKLKEDSEITRSRVDETYWIDNKEVMDQVSKLGEELEADGFKFYGDKYSGSTYYDFYIKRGDNGSICKAVQYSYEGAQIIDVTIDQLIGKEPIDSFETMRRKLGKMLLPPKARKDLVEDVDEKPTPIMTPDETGISLILSNLIKDEWEAIDGYNSAIQTLADLKKDDAITILQDIVKEENVHVGQLEQLLKTFSVDAHDIDKGEQEAEEQLSK